ncbi:cation transporter [Microbacterium paulum]
MTPGARARAATRSPRPCYRITTSALPETSSKHTVRAIGLAFFALAAYVSIDAILSLISQEGPEHSPLGIGITALSLLVMPLLASFEIRTGRELGSKSVLADARQLMLCVYLSGAVFIGLILNSLFGWWWADSVAALIVAALAIREGIEAWRGDVESPFEVLTEMKDE